MNTEKRITVAGIEATLVRKNVKTVRITILPPDGEVRISAPRFYPEASIRAFIEQKADWIKKHVEATQTRRSNAPKNYKTGERVWFFGLLYSLHILENQKKTGVSLDADHITLSFKGPAPTEKRAAVLNDWLRERLKAEIAHYMPIWSERTGLIPSEWTVRNMTSRWGSCNTRTGKITLNLQLAHYPAACLEYVILHELAHLRVHGHGADFKAILDQYMPDWKTRKRILNG